MKYRKKKDVNNFDNKIFKKKTSIIIIIIVLNDGIK